MFAVIIGFVVFLSVRDVLERIDHRQLCNSSVSFASMTVKISPSQSIDDHDLLLNAPDLL